MELEVPLEFWWAPSKGLAHQRVLLATRVPCSWTTPDTRDPWRTGKPKLKGTHVRSNCAPEFQLEVRFHVGDTFPEPMQTDMEPTPKSLAQKGFFPLHVCVKMGGGAQKWWLSSGFLQASLKN